MSAGHSHALRKGTRLSQYEIESILGAGGFGITYLARDISLDAPVAIKEYLPTELAIRQDGTKVTAVSTTARTDFKWGLDRFLDEARVLAKFRHPHIVHIFQVFEANNTAYIVMEYAKGESLSELLQRSGALSETAAREIIVPIMDGLKRVHERGFLHRDIKPGNIILRDEGGPALIDFGAARQAIETKSRSITSIVTEGYAPLEQYDPNGNQGPWTDIYALGAVAYKCVAGKTPPTATSRVRNDPLESLEGASKGRASKQFAAAIAWALAVYEEDRPQTIDEFSQAISGMTTPAKRSQVPMEATRVMRPNQGAPRDAEATQLLGLGRGGAAVVDAPIITASSVRFPSTRVMTAIAVTLLVAVVAFGAWRWFNRPEPVKATTSAAPQAAHYLEELTGTPVIVDTATLIINGHRISLAGISGLSGTNGLYARNLQEAIGEFGNSVTCDRLKDGPTYRCQTQIKQIDVSEMVLLNGAARVSSDATSAQRTAEDRARAAHRGIWEQATN